MEQRIALDYRASLPPVSTVFDPPFTIHDLLELAVGGEGVAPTWLVEGIARKVNDPRYVGTLRKRANKGAIPKSSVQFCQAYRTDCRAWK